jgi:RNA polymerase sigma factor (sigma-70 family)
VAEALFDEKELVIAAQGGSLDAFNALILQYQTRVYNLARYILRDDAAADDAAQEAFIKAYYALDKFNGGSFSTWILRITTNYCYDVLRRHKRYPAVSWEDFGDMEEEANPYLVDRSASPEDIMIQDDLRKVLDRGLSILPDDQRLIVVLVDQMGCNYDEVTKIAGVPLGTVKSRLYRARERLREYLLSETAYLPAQYRVQETLPAESSICDRRHAAPVCEMSQVRS